MYWVVRATYVQPDGVGYLDKANGVSRDSRRAVQFASEAEAWDFILASPYNGRDAKGPWLWPECVQDSQ